MIPLASNSMCLDTQFELSYEEGKVLNIIITVITI